MSLTYLSDEWVEAADALLRSVTIEPPVEGAGFTLETCVTGPDGERRYVLEFTGTGVTARPTVPGERPTVRLSQRSEVAAAVAAGATSAQAAFLAGDIQVGGDVSMLIANAGLVAQVGDVLADLRALTAFDGS
jgi:hypothetical protein